MLNGLEDNIQMLTNAHKNGGPSTLSNLSLVTPCQNTQPCIAIHLFTYGRPVAMEELLQKLVNSKYDSYGKSLPLVIHLDRPRERDMNSTAWRENKKVEQLVVDFQWPHGPKLLDIKATHAGLKGSWLSAWENPNPSDMMVALEDDMDLSPWYFEWVLHVVRTYNLCEADNRDQALLGISLSPMLYDEISAFRESREWLPENHIPPQFPVFLHGAPSSWGAVYFGEHWRRFLSFVAVRDAPPFYEEIDTTAQSDPHLSLPNSRTNIWVRSWKRFMFDYAYGQGAYMIYPNLQSSAGLATSRFLSGEHYGENYSSPMHALLITDEKHLVLNAKWPAYETLPLFDIFCSPVNRTAYAHQGQEFVEKICLLGGIYGNLCKVWHQ